MKMTHQSSVLKERRDSESISDSEHQKSQAAHELQMPEEEQEYLVDDESPDGKKESTDATPNNSRKGREINIEQVDGSNMTLNQNIRSEEVEMNKVGLFDQENR